MNLPRAPLTDEQKQWRRAYDAARYLAKKELLKAQHSAWRAASGEQIKEYRKEWRAKNRDREKAARRAWDRANRDRRKLLAAKWKKANPERARAWHRRWAEQNPHKRAITNQNHRAAKLDRRGKLTADLIIRLRTVQRGKCACCRKRLPSAFHVDHIRPLKLGGDHSNANMQLLCASCNLSKGARDPIEFMQTKGFLL
jgi:5-methylcytosine-specific restriction endonuclease McrA